MKKEVRREKAENCAHRQKSDVLQVALINRSVTALQRISCTEPIHTICAFYTSSISTETSYIYIKRGFGNIMHYTLLLYIIIQLSKTNTVVITQKHRTITP